MPLTIHPLSQELWPALEDLFGSAGASNGCWCMYWRLGPGYRHRSREQNKADLRAAAAQTPPPGLLALDGDRAVGWCQVTPRAGLPWLEQRFVRGRADDGSVWAISCFYVRRDSRGRAVATSLVEAGLDVARRAHASAVEAYPVDTAAPGATRNVFTGTASMFRRLGFSVIGHSAYGRLIMRRDLVTAERS